MPRTQKAHHSQYFCTASGYHSKQDKLLLGVCFVHSESFFSISKTKNRTVIITVLFLFYLVILSISLSILSFSASVAALSNCFISSVRLGACV